MQTLAVGVSFIDLQFVSTPRIIATVVLQGPGGVTLIDPGPASTLPSLTRQLEHAGIAARDVTTLLLTHIHLDHAGACGAFVRAHPKTRVYVHREGVRHLVAPEKLVASAARLYGDEMDRLWGEVLPVPADAIVALNGGEVLETGGRRLVVADTPGHASHHVSYFCADIGVAFVGDTGGIRLGADLPVLPPTPPPDIDLEAWSRSLSVIDGWRPAALFLTHFGPVAPVDAHLAEFRACLDTAERIARAALARDGDDPHREAWFVAQCRQALMRQLGERDVRLYETAARLDLSWRGLARYLRKRVTA